MDKISEKGIETNKSFWNFIKPFMTNKGMIVKMSSQMSMRFHRHSTNTISTLSKKVAETNLIKQVPH